MGTRRGESYRCGQCALLAPKWVGRCEGCGAWGTLQELQPAGAGSGPGQRAREPAVPIADVVAESRLAVPSGSPEFDRVTNGGLVAGSVTLLAGEPGVGKSTLALQLASGAASANRRALYVSAEESPAQVQSRARRLGPLPAELWLSGEADVDTIIEELGRLQPHLLVVDSIQTVAVASASTTPGSITQVRESALRLVDAARAHRCAVLLVGHVTKDGSLAGPRQLEHLVDTVLSFEGDRHHALRLLRAVKHRFGPTSELGLFEMAATGLMDVADGSGLLLADRRVGAAGSTVFPMIDGRRPLLVELQSLVVRGAGATARRSVEGVDASRVSLLLAVLGRVLEIPVLDAEVYCLAAGGVRVSDPGADLALACAIVSSLADRALPPDTVICGEVGLGGEVRSVRHLERRLGEAARAGFRRAIVPVPSPDVEGLELIRVGTIGEALLAGGLYGARPSRRERGLAVERHQSALR